MVWPWPQSLAGVQAPPASLLIRLTGGVGGSRAQGRGLLSWKVGTGGSGVSVRQVLLHLPCTCALPGGCDSSQVCRPPGGGGGAGRCRSAPWGRAPALPAGPLHAHGFQLVLGPLPSCPTADLADVKQRTRWGSADSCSCPAGPRPRKV